MSFAIDPDTVIRIILNSGHEYEVADQSFAIDAYEFIQPHPNPDRDGLFLHGGGAGFGLKTTTGEFVYGPISSLAAVTTDE